MNIKRNGGKYQENEFSVEYEKPAKRMVADADEIQSWIDEIEDTIEESDFQFDFFVSLCDWFVKHKSLSPKQFDSLKKIHERVFYE